VRERRQTAEMLVHLARLRGIKPVPWMPPVALALAWSRGGEHHPVRERAARPWLSGARAVRHSGRSRRSAQSGSKAT
jgi:hypothetical protein